MNATNGRSTVRPTRSSGVMFIDIRTSSNCRTTDDGCIVEHFRYAIDAGGLDYLATSDHTEVGKTLIPMSGFQSQKPVDIFQTRNSFSRLRL